MASNYLPPIEFLRECFSYDPETGVLRWRRRPNHHFTGEPYASMWNAQNAGNRAFQGRDKDGYGRSQVCFEGRRYRMRSSRVAYKLMTGEEPEQVDHKNLDTTDDSWVNLRAATQIQNQANRPGKKTSVLPKCASFESGRFRAYARRDGKMVRLGLFDTPAEAHAAYCAFAAPLQGEFFNPGEGRLTIFD